MTSYSHVDNKGVPLDQKLDKLFGQKRNGFFIELGANDGIKQSNTAFLEFYRDWKGVLIEPSHNAFEQCKENRPNSSCYNVACVSSTFEGNFIEGDFNGNLMSSVDGKRLSSSNKIAVEATTLEKILNSINANKIDLLSLDTEGYELPILEGLNLDRYRPSYLLIEIYNKDYDSLVSFLNSKKYKLIENFSNYNPKDNPHWDSTHNDYLFKDTSLETKDICSGEKFQQLCDVYCGVPWHLQRNPVISAQVEKHINLETLTEEYDNPKLVFCYSCSLELLMDKIQLFKNKFILVSHNEDENITEKYHKLVDNPKIVRWFAQNLMMNHEKVEMLPIGLANAMWPHGNLQHLVNVVGENIKKENDVLFNFTMFSNGPARSHCKNELEKKGLQFISYTPRDQYLQMMAKYKFAICPDGHGVDCHRIWEAYYLNTIPVLLKSPFSLHLQKYLPCIILDKWEDLNIAECVTNYDSYIQQLNNSRKYLLFDTYKEKIQNAVKSLEMNIAYAYIGSLPSYAVDTVHQLRLFYNGPVYFIISDYDSPLVPILQSKYNVQIVRYDSVYHQEFNDTVTKAYDRFCIVDRLKGREKIFIYAFERFFVLYNLMKQREVYNVFFMEIDNLVYDDPRIWLSEFSKKEMAYMYDNYERFASGVCYIKSFDYLQLFLDYCIHFILNTNLFLTEMSALYEFYNTHKETVQLLPVHWTDPNMPIEAYENYNNYGNSIFDAAAIGVFLGGADPVHTQGVIVKGKKNQWSFIDYTKYEYKWQADDKERMIPYILHGNIWLRINNLHIHSKDLVSNLSKPIH
jgi:FkbM family methyltransferase